jgi:hypothetical protein
MLAELDRVLELPPFLRPTSVPLVLVLCLYLFHIFYFSLMSLEMEAVEMACWGRQ